MSKYSCPMCGSQLKAWQEYIYQKEVLLNPKTGKFNKTIKVVEKDKDYDNMGLECTNKSCNWMLNMIKNKHFEKKDIDVTIFYDLEFPEKL